MNQKVNTTLKKTLKLLFMIFYWIIIFIWLMQTDLILLKGLISFPDILSGIIFGILHLSSGHNMMALLESDARMLTSAVTFLLIYILLCYLATILTISLLLQSKRHIKKIITNAKIFFSKGQIINYCLLAIFLLVSFYWVLSTINIAINLGESKGGVESIIRDQFQLDNNEPVFDKEGNLLSLQSIKVVKAIVLYYLKYIGLLYLEAILIFVFLFLFKGKKERLEVDSDNTR